MDADRGHAHAIAGGGASQVARSIPAAQRAQATEAIHSAFASAMNDILLVAAIVALVGACIGLAAVRRSDFASYAAPSAEPAVAG